MHALGQSQLHLEILLQRVITCVGTGDRTVMGDLMFLRAWDAGLVPWLSSAMRVRQIRRANTVVAIQDVPDAPGPQA